MSLPPHPSGTVPSARWPTLSATPQSSREQLRGHTQDIHRCLLTFRRVVNKRHMLNPPVGDSEPAYTRCEEGLGPHDVWPEG